MLVREHQNQFRGAQADVQFFYGARQANSRYSWNKPVGTTFVYIMLIGGGGAGDLSTQGGGSGSIAVWFGPAKNIPNALTVSFSTSVVAVSTLDRTGLDIIFRTAPASTVTGGVATTADGYWASGFYNFTAGENGSTSNVGASQTTFLSRGGTSSPVVGNYGNTTTSGGFLRISPIISGVSAANNTGSNASYGNGVYYTDGSPTPGMAIIASW